MSDECDCSYPKFGWPGHAEWCKAEVEGTPPKSDKHDWGTFNVSRQSWTCDRCGFELFKKAQGRDLPPCPGD